MTDCTCPFTFYQGNSFMVTKANPDCSVHGKVASTTWWDNLAERLKAYHDIYEPEGICPVCKTWHRQGEKGNCGKG